LFAEAYQQINGEFSDLYSIGGDFRYYVKIHRTLIWANRFASGASFGSSRLIYYLGSVDNWINFSTKVETFDKSIPVDYSKNYVYQTLATNMRGFTQNIRNGDRFAVANTELRWPVIRYFANHPISSNFWNNFMLAGFCDVGTAWSGLHPWSRENAYDNKIIENGPIRVIIDANRQPIVIGYGAGLRSMLLGYFIRLDWAWGIENNVLLPRIFYFSLSLDF
jgi:outer membrane protein assembly factor BamA